MPSHNDSNSDARRPTAMERTSSSQSASRGSPGGATARPKHHRAASGRIHARTPSYGKNLHKLSKIVSGDTENSFASSSKKKQPTSPTSPLSGTMVRRNTSAVNLSKNAAKAPIRKNKSEVSLMRNHSSTHLHRPKPTVPLKRNESHGKDLHKSKHKHAHKFDAQEIEDEGDWTEESASPVITRQSSLSKGSRNPSRLGSPPRPVEPIERPDFSALQPDGTEDISPGSPPEPRFELAQLDQMAREELVGRRQSRDTGIHPDVLASRLLSGQTITSGQHQRPTSSNRVSFAPENGSTPWPSNGVSRFLGTTAQTLVPSTNSSLGRSHGTNSSAERPETPASPAPEQDLKRSASAGNLTKGPIIATEDSRKDAKVPSYTIATTGPGRSGAATQTRIELWRSLGKVEPTDGPMMKGTPMDLLDNEGRRKRLWEEAEKELNALGRFVNPVLESAKRANAQYKAYQGKSNQLVHVNGTSVTSRGSISDGKANLSNGVVRRSPEAARDSQHAPPSRAVRFEVGVEPDSNRSINGVESVDAILNRLWNSNEVTSVEG